MVRGLNHVARPRRVRAARCRRNRKRRDERAARIVPGAVKVLAILSALALLGCGRRSVIETLENATAVERIEDHGLVLRDGRRIEWGFDVPNAARLRAVHAAVEQGIEVTPEGCPIGLIRIHHWCGNDNIRRHWARVDVRKLLEFLPHVWPPAPHNPGDRSWSNPHFGRHGWNWSKWRQFEKWSGRDPDRIYR